MFISYYIDKQIGLKKGENRSPLFGAYIIISESMIPSINVYDAVVTVRVSEDKIKIDDIITFISKEIDTAGTPITHRVIGMVDTESGVKYRTKGDHNNAPDFALISPNEVIGKVYLRIPMIGYLQTFMTKPLGWIIIIVIPCLIMIGSDIFKILKINKKQNFDNNSSSNDYVTNIESNTNVENIPNMDSNTNVERISSIENNSNVENIQNIESNSDMDSMDNDFIDVL